ncbi:phage tail protein [Actinosynnema sp. CA-248983]
MAVVGHAFLKILASVEGIGTALDRAVDRAERTAPSVSLGVDLRVAELHAQIEAALRAAADRRVTVPVAADTRPAERDVESLRRAESDRSIRLAVTLDRSVGAAVRGLAALDEGVTRSTATITRHTSAVGLSTLRYAALAAAAGQVVTVLGGLGATAATASGSLLLLPAAGIAAAVALNVLRLGTTGLADALAATDPAAFAEAVAEMPPAMQATARAVRELQGEFAGVRLDVQQRLFADLGREVADLGALHLPAAREGLGDMADSLNATARGFGLFAREAQTVADVRTILNNSATAMGKLAGGVAPVLSGLRDIAAVGSSFLPALASGLAEGASSFGEFIAQARQTGQLEQWISGGLSALGELFTLLGNIVRIVGAVFAAADAGGASLLGTLNALTGSLAAFLSTGEGSVALQQLFAALGEIASGLLPLLVAVARTVATVVVPAVAQLGPQLAQALGVLADGVGPAGQILASLTPLAGAAAQAFASLLVPALGAVAGVTAELAPAVQTVVGELVGGALPDAVRELSPALISLARAAAPLIVQFGQLLVQAVRTAAPALANLLTLLTPIAVQLGGALLTAASDVLPVLGQLADLWTQVLVAGLQAALPVLPVAVTVIQQLADVLSTRLAQATPTLVQIGQLLGETLAVGLTGLLPLLPQLVDGLLRIGVEGLLPLAPPLLDLVVTLLPSLISLVETLMPVVVLATGVLATWAGMIARVAADVSEKLGPVLVWLIDNVVRPVFANIASTVSGTLTFLQGLLDTVMGVITGDWSRAWNGLKDILSGALQAAWGAANLATGGLLDLIASLPRRILDALGDLGSLLVEAGRNIIRGLLRGIESMINSVRDKLRQLTNLLPSWKGPPERDRTLLRANGVLIMRGLVSGLEQGEPAVRRYLADLTASIPQQAAPDERAGRIVTGRVTATSSGAAVPADLAEFVAAVRELASRPVIVQVGATEIARATAEGERILSRR